MFTPNIDHINFANNTIWQKVNIWFFLNIKWVIENQNNEKN